MTFLLFNKPFRVLSQFTDEGSGKATLKDFIPVRGVYPAGRLDFDSEGLLLLTDDGRLQARIADPRHKLEKTYIVQVEGLPSIEAIRQLTDGISLREGPARAVSAHRAGKPEWLWPRDPPIRVRRSIPDSWIEITLTEGRNRQVRRMTAAIGHPTLRLVRIRIGEWSLGGLAPGAWREIAAPDRRR